MSNIKAPYGDVGMPSFEAGINFGGTEELFSGASPQYGTFEDFSVPSGLSLPAFSVVKVTAGAVALAVQGTPATGITTAPIVANGQAQRVAVAQSGCFNPAALNFDASYDTLQKKLDAFRGAPAPTGITVRPRL